MGQPDAPLEDVRGFWNTEACGTHFVTDYCDRADFYRKYREQRYRTEWHIPLIVPFAEAKGKSVLEIGTGNGADGVTFAQQGAVYTGVDLTDAALEATRRHFETLQLPGTFQKGNAEQLAFADQTFDMVYSHGVLHHTPQTAKAVGEVHRVLKPGGKAIVMLYHKRSFNYFVRIMLYMRVRVALKILSRIGRWTGDRQALRDTLVGVRGNADRRVWQLHYHNFLRRGWEYLAAKNFVHHAADGPECPIAFAFTKAEVRELFSSFHKVELSVFHFPLRRYRAGAWIPWAVEKFMASRLGWYLCVSAIK